jgi:trans-2,3-dihydro-3-hydroxyanthranilate isomerase
MIVALKTLDALKKACIAKDLYLKLIANTDAKLILLFAPQTRDPKNNLSVRVFADYYGVPEDPATGAANGCLAGYLVMHRYFGTDQIDIRVEQGHEIGRPSLIMLRAQKRDGEVEVHVGGRVILVAKGELV